jgi:hypothetical protein
MGDPVAKHNQRGVFFLFFFVLFVVQSHINFRLGRAAAAAGGGGDGGGGGGGSGSGESGGEGGSGGGNGVCVQQRVCLRVNATSSHHTQDEVGHGPRRHERRPRHHDRKNTIPVLKLKRSRNKISFQTLIC